MRARHGVLFFRLVLLFHVPVHDDTDDNENEDQNAGHAPDDDAHALVIDEAQGGWIDGRLDFRTLGAAGAQIDHHRLENQKVGVIGAGVIDGARFLATACQVGIKAASDPFGEHKEAIAAPVLATEAKEIQPGLGLPFRPEKSQRFQRLDVVVLIAVQFWVFFSFIKGCQGTDSQISLVSTGLVIIIRRRGKTSPGTSSRHDAHQIQSVVHDLLDFEAPD